MGKAIEGTIYRRQEMLAIKLLVVAIPLLIVGYFAYTAGLRDGKKEAENERV